MKTIILDDEAAALLVEILAETKETVRRLMPITELLGKDTTKEEDEKADAAFRRILAAVAFADG